MPDATGALRHALLMGLGGMPEATGELRRARRRGDLRHRDHPLPSYD
jgi:hypothetical protein